MKKKLAVVGLVCLFLLSTLLTSCDSKKEDTTGKEDVTQSSEQNEGSITYGGSIVVGITNDLDSLDPHKAVAAGTKEVLFNIFEGLVKLNSDGELVAAVAETYEVSEDARTYTFVLRDGVKFHTGEPVTIEDVVYSIQRCAGQLKDQDPMVVVIPALSCIESVNIVDERTVELKLNEANTELMYSMTFAIVPAGYNQQDVAPVGTGPFEFVSYEALGRLVLKKNEQYYIEGIPYLDQVTFKISADTQSAFMELLAGTIDIFPYLTQTQASQLTSGYEIRVGNTNLVQALFLNNAAKPFDDPRVRQALCYAIDRQAILDFVAGGNGTIIGSNMYPNLKTYYDASLASSYTYNPTRAKELLEQAGYPQGFSFTIKVPSNYQFHVDTAQVLVEQLKQIGVTANLQLVEWASWLEDVYKGRNYEATIIGLDSDLVPSDILMRYQSDSSKNFINYNNVTFDQVYQLAVQTIDQQKKVEYYQQLQALLSEDAASVYIQDPASLVAVKKTLGGYAFYPVYVQDMSLVYYRGE